MIKLTRDEMIAQLVQRECRVVFKKVNGEERDMTCTLMEAILPEPTTKPVTATPAKERDVKKENIICWDLNAKGYRTFKVENVVSFT